LNTSITHSINTKSAHTIITSIDGKRRKPSRSQNKKKDWISDVIWDDSEDGAEDGAEDSGIEA
jgi:hypothetical protein